MTTSIALAKTSRSYYRQYESLPYEDFQELFFPKLTDFLTATLEDYHVTHKPSRYLDSLAKQGLYQAPIYTGWIPVKQEKALAGDIRDYLMKLFKIKDFSGFKLIFDRHRNYTKIVLSWHPGDPQFIIPKTKNGKPVLGVTASMSRIAKSASKPIPWKLPQPRPASQRNDIKPTTNAGPIQFVVLNNSDLPPELQQALKQNQSVKPAKPVKPTKPVKPVKLAKPTKPTKILQEQLDHLETDDLSEDIPPPLPPDLPVESEEQSKPETSKPTVNRPMFRMNLDELLLNLK